MNHKYTWKRDLPDIRDFKFRDHHLLGGIQLPPSVDLRSQMPPVVDQSTAGSCTANALSGALGFLESQALRTKVASPEEFNPNTFTPFSRLFIYFNERDLEGDPTTDGGAQIRDGIKTLAQYGGCDEILWPYDLNNLFVKPSDPCYTEALQHKISSYYSLDNDLFALKSALASGYPVVFGFTVYDYFESPEMMQTGVLNVPQTSEECLGGHAVLLSGFNDADRTFWVRNSWGTSWGPFGGYFKMSYDYISNPDLTDDFWVVTK
jgi:C1A family cysteine protease